MNRETDMQVEQDESWKKHLGFSGKSKQDWFEEIKAAAAGGDKLKLALAAVKEWPAVDTWSFFLELYSHDDIKCDTSDFPPTMLEAAHRAYSAVRYWVGTNGGIWKTYFDELCKIDDQEKIKHAFIDRLSVPHVGIDDTFGDYSEFISRTDPDNYEASMSEASALVSASKRILNDRERWELQVSSASASATKRVVLEQYLQWELDQNLQHYDLVSPLFERLLGDGAKEELLWQRYIWYHLLKRKSHNVWQLANRALANCPTPKIAASQLRLQSQRPEFSSILELIDSPANYAKSEVFQLQALSSLAMTASNEQLIEYFTHIIKKSSINVLYLGTALLTCVMGYMDAAKFWIERSNELPWSEDPKFWTEWFSWTEIYSNEGAKSRWSSAVVKMYRRNVSKYPNCASTSMDENVERYYLIEKNFYELENEYYLRSLRGKAEPNTTIKRRAESDDVPSKKQEVSSSSGQRDRENSTLIIKGQVSDEMLRNTLRDIEIISINRRESYLLLELSSRRQKLMALASLKFTKNADLTIDAYDADDTTVFLTNFPPEWTSADIESRAASYGSVLSLRLPSRKFNVNRRFAYIQYSSADEAHAAISGLNNDNGIVAKISDPDRKSQRQGALEESREVFITGLNYELTDNQVRTFIEQIVSPESIRVPTSAKNSRKNDGYGFATFSTSAVAEVAVSQLDGRELAGKRIHAQISERKSKVNARQVVRRLENAEDIKDRIVSVGNVSEKVNREQLQKIFSVYGEVVSIELNASQGTAKVEFSKISDSGRAAMGLDGYILEGSALRIEDRRKVVHSFKPRIMS